MKTRTGVSWLGDRLTGKWPVRASGGHPVARRPAVADGQAGPERGCGTTADGQHPEPRRGLHAVAA